MKTPLSRSRRAVGALLLLAALPASAENWPAFRGGDGTGTSAEKNLPLKWSVTDGVKWRIDLPERGNSSPIVWGDRVFLTQAVSAQDRRTLLCLDRATGKQLWQAGVTYPEREQSHRDNPYCSATPVTDGERVIAFFGSAGLYCYDFAGKELWRRDLGKMSHQFGNAASPVLAGDLCVVNFGPDEKARIVAVNKRTGEIAWEVAAPKSDEGAMPPRGPQGDRFSRGGDDRFQRPPEPERPRAIDPGQLAAPQIVAQADKNADARVSRDEFTALATAWFDKLDRDKAGKLERRTFSERFSDLLPPPVAADARPDAPNPVRVLGFAFASISDSDRDGTLTRDEWNGAFAKWFADWDAEKSGALDVAKLSAGLNSALPRPQFGGAPIGGGFGGDRGFGGGGGRGPGGSWSTPVLVKSGAREELIVHFPGKIAALDPKTGKELWSAQGLGGASYTTPVVGEGVIVHTSSGPGGGAAAALKPRGSGDVTETQRLWKLDRFQSAVGTGVISGGHLYTISQAGIAACSDLKTGATVWQERLQGGSARGGSWSSILLADGKLYIPNQGGDVFVLRAAPKFEVLAANSVGEPTNASLAASDGALFLRTDKSLWCFATTQ
jgi:outer membrane protein assembly factor BamB